MSYQKFCWGCGKNFTARNKNQGYCCDACKSRTYYQRSRKSEKEYTPRHKVTCQKCWERMKKKGNTYICSGCGERYVIDSLGRINYTSILKSDVS